MVESMISSLSLQGCAHTRISMISGGERKRCSIACEMLSNPRILILDEPTSGLDSGLASSLIDCLQDLAIKRSLTVICAVHQPTSSVLFMFHRVLVLCEGCMVYNGEPQNIMPYLESRGFPMQLCYNSVCRRRGASPPPPSSPPRTPMSSKDTELNPLQRTEESISGFPFLVGYSSIDYLLDLLHSRVPFQACTYNPKISCQPPIPNQPQLSEGLWWPRYILMHVFDYEALEAHCSTELATCDATNTTHNCLTGEGITGTTDERARSEGRSDSKLTSNIYMVKPCKPWWFQFKVLFHRSCICIYRSDQLDCVSLSVILTVAALSGLCWFQISHSEKRVADVCGYLFFTVVFWFFNSLFDGLLSFMPERRVLVRDRRAGAYQMSAYFMAKSLSATPARILVLPWVYFTISYFVAIAFVHPPAMSLSHAVNNYLKCYGGLLGVIMLTCLAAESLGVFIGTLTANFHVAVSLCTVCSLAMLVGGGFYVKEFPIFLQWLQYLSILRYSYNAALQILFTLWGFIECDHNGMYIPACLGKTEVDSKVVLPWILKGELSVTGNVCVLIVFYVILQLCGYLSMRFYVHAADRNVRL